MSTVKITLHRISEDRHGKKSIHYTVETPDGTRLLGCSVLLGGTIDVTISPRPPEIATTNQLPPYATNCNNVATRERAR